MTGPAVNAIGDTKAWSIGRRMGTTCRGALSSLVMRKVGTYVYVYIIHVCMCRGQEWVVHWPPRTGSQLPRRLVVAGDA